MFEGPGLRSYSVFYCKGQELEWRGVIGRVRKCHIVVWNDPQNTSIVYSRGFGQAVCNLGCCLTVDIAAWMCLQEWHSPLLQCPICLTGVLWLDQSPLVSVVKLVYRSRRHCLCTVSGNTVLRTQHVWNVGVHCCANGVYVFPFRLPSDSCTMFDVCQDV